MGGTISEDLQPLLITRVRCDQVKVAGQSIRHDSAPRLAADSGPCTLHYEAASPRPLLWHMQHSDGQRRREDGHTDTDVNRGGGAVVEQKNPEQL